MRHWIPWLMGLCFYINQASASVNDFDLQVCVAHLDRASQLECCAELGVKEAVCKAGEKKQPSSAVNPPLNGKFFYCNTRYMDGSGEDINKWGKGSDFKFVSEKGIWEWRSDYSVRSIDAGGGFYETSLIRNGTDRIGECDPAIRLQYENQMKVIMDKYGN